MVYRLWITIVAFAMVSLGVSAQTKRSDSIPVAPKPEYVQYMNNQVMLKLGQYFDAEALQVNTGTNKITLSPNATSATKLSVNYKFISFTLRYVPKFLPGNDDNAEKGRTKSAGFGFNFNFKHWLQEVSYGKTRGYYLENTRDYITGWQSGDPYLQFPELVSKSYKGVTAYNFNPNFSVNAVATQTERQLKSAGSFIPHLMYRFYIIDDQTTRTSTSTTQKTNNFEVILGAGYYHTFVFKKNIYFSAGLTPAGGYVFTRLLSRLPTGYVITHQTNPIFRLDAAAGLGYNGERYFGGFYTRLATSAYNQKKTSAVNNEANLAFQVFFGVRLKAFKFLREKVEQVEEIVPFL